jgi:N4-gp56 family major capsid protein
MTILCKHGATGDTPTNITRQDLNKAMIYLLGKEAPREGDPEYGCCPIRSFYLCFVDYKMIYDMRNCDGFISISEYPESAKDQILIDEIGAIGNFRIIVCNEPPSIRDCTVKASALGEDIYTITCCALVDGRLPYGNTDLWVELKCTMAFKK